MPVFSFFNDGGVPLFVAFNANQGPAASEGMPAGVFRSRCVVPGNLFAEGHVLVLAEVSTRRPVYQIHVLEHDVVAFNVVERGLPGSVRGDWGRSIPGVVRPMTFWQTDRVE
jgi:hypothetical protein